MVIFQGKNFQASALNIRACRIHNQIDAAKFLKNHLREFLCLLQISHSADVSGRSLGRSYIFGCRFKVLFVSTC